MPNDPSAAPRKPESGKPASAILGKLGIGLILLSGVFFFSMLSVPWWPMTAGAKVIVAGGLMVGVQVAWWAGVALAGPATVGKIRGWFRRSESDVNNTHDPKG